MVYFYRSKTGSDIQRRRQETKPPQFDFTLLYIESAELEIVQRSKYNPRRKIRRTVYFMNWTSPTIFLWSGITFDLEQLMKIKSPDEIFLRFPQKPICVDIHKLDKNSLWWEFQVIIRGMTAAEFCISCRRSLQNSDNRNGQGSSFDNHLEFLWGLEILGGDEKNFLIQLLQSSELTKKSVAQV